MTFAFKNQMAVAGHRGDSHNYYENTMEAFQAAVNAGAEMVETDIHLTADGYAVLIHDDTVHRTSDTVGSVKDFTLAQLQTINVGDALQPANIPTLEAFLQWAKPLDVLLNLELKEYKLPANGDRWMACADETIRLVRQYGMEDRVVLNSFDAAVLDYIDRKYRHSFRLHGFYPHTKMINVERDPDEYMYCACIWGCYKKKEYYDHLLEKGIEPWVGSSVTSQEALELCCRYGAKLVTTNHPADIIEKLKKLGKRV